MTLIHSYFCVALNLVIKKKIKYVYNFKRLADKKLLKCIAISRENIISKCFKNEKRAQARLMLKNTNIGIG